MYIVADGKALSKVASALNMQESIRLTLSGRKNDMKVQNDRLQTEINGKLETFHAIDNIALAQYLQYTTHMACFIRNWLQK